jgi:hypothetical protein
MSGKGQFGTVRKLLSGRWQARYRDSCGRIIAAPSTFPTKTDPTHSSRWLTRPGQRVGR